MQRALRCECGRPQADAIQHVQRGGDRRFRYLRCACGREWTIVEKVIDLVDPVSADEVLEVHRLLERDEAEPWMALFRG